MPGPLQLIVKSATEYRVGSPDGEIETAEKTTALTLVSLVGDHAVCEKNGGHIFIAGGARTSVPSRAARAASDAPPAARRGRWWGRG